MSGFTFGTPAPAAAAPSSGFSFGSTPAPAPSTGGFSFGSTPAPASSAPAPATGGFSFGGSTTSTPAPASSGFSFGGSSTPATAPASSGFSFGGSTTTPAPAPSSGGGFSFGGLTPAPSTPSSGLFGGVNTQSSNTMSQQSMHISANMRFSSLPPNAQKIISDTFMLFHQHKQTMNSVASMTPSFLATEADRAAGITSRLPDTKSEIQKRQQDLKEEISTVQQRFNDLNRHVRKVQQEANDLYNLAHECGIYPVQTIAARRRITLPGSYKNGVGASSSSVTGGGTPTSAPQSSIPDVVKKLNTMLRENATHVDRMEGLPSMYLWKLIEDMDTRLQNLGRNLVKLEKDIKNRENVAIGSNYANEENPVESISLGIQNQVDILIQVANFVGRMSQQLEVMRQVYKEKLTAERLIRSSQFGGMSPTSRLNTYDMTSMIDHGGKSFDPFLDADRREAQEENRIKLEVKKRNINARSSLPSMNPALANTTVTPSSNSTPTLSSGLFSTPSAGGGLFGSKPAATGLFSGSSTSNPTSAAPSSGFSFGGSSTPAPAPSTGGFSFGTGTTPAPAATAPSSGFSFGGSSTPAPAPSSGGFSFGGSTTPAPAPASSGFSFGGSTPPAAPASSGFNFGGSTTAPAPAPSSGGGFSFGGSAPAPAAADPVTPSAPSRSNVRQRRAGRRR